VKSYYCICTSCASFVNSSDIAELLLRIAYLVMCSSFLLSHALRLWLPPAPNPVEPLILGLPFASCPVDKSCSSSYGCCGCSEYKTIAILYAAAHKLTMAVPTPITGSESKVRLQLVNVKQNYFRLHALLTRMF